MCPELQEARQKGWMRPLNTVMSPAPVCTLKAGRQRLAATSLTLIEAAGPWEIFQAAAPDNSRHQLQQNNIWDAQLATEAAAGLPDLPPFYRLRPDTPTMLGLRHTNSTPTNSPIYPFYACNKTFWPFIRGDGTIPSDDSGVQHDPAHQAPY
jgi:hypothetical protein